MARAEGDSLPRVSGPRCTSGQGQIEAVADGLLELGPGQRGDDLGKGVACEVLRPGLAAPPPVADVGGDQPWLDEGRRGESDLDSEARVDERIAIEMARSGGEEEGIRDRPWPEEAGVCRLGGTGSADYLEALPEARHGLGHSATS